VFGKSKNDTAEVRSPTTPPQVQRAPLVSVATTGSPETTSTVSAGTSIVGKIISNGTVNIFGRVEGELQAATIVISDGAQVEGDITAEDLIIGGRVKGTVHANRVKLNNTAMVAGDIFHKSLAIEENAQFEGSSRREDAAADTPLRVELSRAHPHPVLTDGKPKQNGASDAETRGTVAAG